MMEAIGITKHDPAQDQETSPAPAELMEKASGIIQQQLTDVTSEENADTSYQLHGLPLWALTFALMLAVLVIGLDGSVISEIFPCLERGKFVHKN
jgi:hypothetical protein